MIENMNLKGEQLNFLEDLDQSNYVRVRVLKEGFSDPEGDSPKYENAVCLAALNSIQSRFAKDNLWRSWIVFSDPLCKEKIGHVPGLIDIDDESDPPDIEKAYRVTDACIHTSLALDAFCGDISRLMITFSGRKGFHIEFKPKSPINLARLRTELIKGCRDRGLSLQYGNKFLESSVIDTLNPSSKPWIRLNGTRYSWMDKCGRIRSRTILRMKFPEFQQLGVDGILNKSEAGDHSLEEPGDAARFSNDGE